MVAAYSIGTGQRSTFQASRNYFVPGPGAYNPEKQQKIQPPAYKIGTSQRNLTMKTIAPGPGAYNPALKIVKRVSSFQKVKKAPQWSFSQSSLTDQAKPMTPGPGSYNQDISIMVKSNPRFSMRQRLNNQFVERVPGPGAYENKSTVVGVPSSKFSQAHRLNTSYIENVPGPGSYENKSTVVGVPSSKFAQAHRTVFYDRNVNPGPGAYQIRSRIGEGPKVQMLGQKNDPSIKDNSFLPGPGAYHAIYNIVKKRPASAKIGTSTRCEISNSDGPGVGQYNLVAKAEGQSWGFGHMKRPALNDSSDTPGPGGYDIKPMFADVPKYLLGPQVMMKVMQNKFYFCPILQDYRARKQY